MLLYAGIKAISIVQLFNWFPVKGRSSAICFLTMSESLGFVTQFFSAQWWSYFPEVPLNQPNFLPVFAIRHFVSGSLFIVIALVDYFTFVNYPVQKGLVLPRGDDRNSVNYLMNTNGTDFTAATTENHSRRNY